MGVPPNNMGARQSPHPNPGGMGGPMGQMGPGGQGPVRQPVPGNMPPGNQPLNPGQPRPAMGNLFGDPLSGQKPPGR